MSFSVGTGITVVCGLTLINSLASGGLVKRSDDTNPLEPVVQQLSQTLQAVQAELAAVKTSVISNTGQLRKAVAFTAFFSADGVTLAPNGPLRFDDVRINIGNGYDKNSGIFTAPYSGVYVFILSVMVQDTYWIQVALDNSGTTLAVAHADDVNDDWDKGVADVSVHLNAGDKVWARHNAGNTGISGSWWTSLSGFLVHAD